MLRKTAKADWRRDERPLKEDGYVTELLAREAATIIARHDPAGRCCSWSPSTRRPFYGAPKALLDKYRDFPDDARRSYAAAVTALDAAVGEILAALEKRKCWTNTLIVFQSDNGGAVPTRFPPATGRPAARRRQRRLSRGAGQPVRRRRARRGAGIVARQNQAQNHRHRHAARD